MQGAGDTLHASHEQARLDKAPAGQGGGSGCWVYGGCTHRAIWGVRRAWVHPQSCRTAASPEGLLGLLCAVPFIAVFAPYVLHPPCQTLPLCSPYAVAPTPLPLKEASLVDAHEAAAELHASGKVSAAYRSMCHCPRASTAQCMQPETTGPNEGRT